MDILNKTYFNSVRLISEVDGRPNVRNPGTTRAARHPCYLFLVHKLHRAYQANYYNTILRNQHCLLDATKLIRDIFTLNFIKNVIVQSPAGVFVEA